MLEWKFSAFNVNQEAKINILLTVKLKKNAEKCWFRTKQIKDFRIPVTSDVAFTSMATSATPTYDQPQDQQIPVISYYTTASISWSLAWTWIAKVLLIRWYYMDGSRVGIRKRGIQLEAKLAMQNRYILHTSEDSIVTEKGYC